MAFSRYPLFFLVTTSMMFVFAASALANPPAIPAPKAPLRVAQSMAHQPPTPGKAAKKKEAQKAKKGEDTISGVHGVLSLAVSYNLLGLRAIGAIGYRKRLFKSNSKLLRENFIGAHAIARLTPAWLEGGAVLAIQPITIFKLRAAYRYRIQVPTFYSGGMFESLDQVNKTFAGDGAKHTDQEQKLKDQIAAVQKANGDSRVLPRSSIISFDATLRFKMKGILLLANARYSMWNTTHDQSDKYKYFYEGGMDMIFASGDEQFLQVEGVVGYEFSKYRLMVFGSYRNAFQSGSLSTRIGPAFQWLMAPNYGWFKNPALFVLAAWYLNHDFRGRDGVPMIAVRFGGSF